MALIESLKIYCNNMFILDNNRLTIYFILAYKDAGRTNQNLNNFF